MLFPEIRWPSLMSDSHTSSSQATPEDDSPARRKIAERRTLGERRNLETDVLNSIGECVYEWDIDKDILTWSDGAHRLMNLGQDTPIGTTREFNALLIATTESTRNDAILSSTTKDEGEGVRYRLQYALAGSTENESSDLWLEDSGKWFAGEDGLPQRAHGIVRIVNERRLAEQKLEHLSRHDPLTGMFNRAHLNACLQSTFDEIARTGESAAFMVIGLEHFDLINSVYGYDAGDAVIAEVANRLKENLRDRDIIGRFSGAKIGVILSESNDRDMLVAGYRTLNMLRENVVNTSSGPIAVSISIGGVVIPQHARNVKQAFMAAHQALGESRRGRDASIVSYRRDAKRDQERQVAARTAERIVTALKKKRIHLAWQPIVDATSGEIAFHEALIRLKDEDGTLFEAGEFVAIAQRLGLIRLVDHYALDLALQTLAQNKQAKFSLNVSNETACDPEWLSKLAHGAYRTPGLAQRLIVEITESHAAESMEEANSFISSVHDIGCKVALDDFGAGFTSFKNLKSLPFDIIKVDGQFADNLGGSHINQSFIKALVDLAQLFNAETVVEWVEDESTATLLRDWGVDYLQGFQFGQPSATLPWLPVETPLIKKTA